MLHPNYNLNIQWYDLSNKTEEQLDILIYKYIIQIEFSTFQSPLIVVISFTKTTLIILHKCKIIKVTFLYAKNPNPLFLNLLSKLF